ncbi:MAG: hypothetical protein D6805_03465 [Planctomycetota bacterium]|nr:MAG: hypothetical protein D6805_03465 [Planctomycetota bacterium]
MLVGADGVGGTVARQMGIYESLEDYPLVHGLNLYISEGDWRSCRLFKEKVPLIGLGYENMQGYAFAYPFRTGVQLGVFAQRREGLEAHFSSWRQRLWERGYIPSGGGEVAKRYFAPAGVGLLLEKNYEKRTLLVGDAGGFCIGTTAHGIQPAFLSSEVAVEIILKGLEEGNLDEWIPTYSKTWNLRFGEYIKGSIELQSNLSFLLKMIFKDERICARYAQGFLFGKKVI